MRSFCVYSPICCILTYCKQYNIIKIHTKKQIKAGDMVKSKAKAAKEAKTRYNKKAYDVIAVRVPKEMAEAFKQKCNEKGTAQAQIIKGAISDFITAQ